MSSSLHEKTALVTGGARGIGEAIVRRLAAEGADIAFTYRNSRDTAHALAAELTETHGVRVLSIQADAGDPDEAARAVHEATQALGSLDILVHNAGFAAYGSIEDADVDDYRRQFSVNVDGVYAGTHAAIPFLNDGARIIIIGSIIGERVPFAASAIYGATKSAVASLARGWSRDLAGRGILVNTIQPGPIDTDLNPADSDFAETITSMISLARYGRTDEIAGVAAFLAGPDASYITGATINVDGGLTA